MTHFKQPPSSLARAKLRYRARTCKTQTLIQEVDTAAVRKATKEFETLPLADALPFPTHTKPVVLLSNEPLAA